MLEQTNYAGPCTLTCKTEAGTGNLSIAFNSIIISATEHAGREAGLPGRVDRETTYCRSCGCETTADRICPDCAEALRAERAEAQTDLLRRHGAASCATCALATARQSIDWHGHIGTPVTWYYCSEHLDCIDGSHYLRGRC